MPAGDARRPASIRAPDRARPLVVRVAAEERGHENRDDGDGLPKARQLRLKPQIRLVGAEAVDGEVRALDAEHRANLRGDASSHVSPSPNITDSPVNRIVGRSRSTASPGFLTR